MLKERAKLIFVIVLVVLTSCSKNDDQPNPGPPEDDTPKWNFEVNGIPRFVSANYIDLTQIQRISKFRSSEGHDYSDDYEDERSMKHYFVPTGWENGGVEDIPIEIKSPIDGTIFIRWDEGSGGQQLWITSEDYPSFHIIIFHVVADASLQVGVQVSEGQVLGHHERYGTWSDIAVASWTEFPENDDGKGIKMVSFFDVLTDEAFMEYSQHDSIDSREDLIIPKDIRDQYPGFRDFPWQESWIYLQ